MAESSSLRHRKIEVRNVGYKFTHQQLASAIGTTRVTVSRMMAQFQAKGHLTLDLHRHLILDNNYFCNLGNWK